MDDFYQLTDRQRDMVFQFMEMMSSDSIEVAQAILTVNGWDLQKAIEDYLSDQSKKFSKQTTQESFEEWEKMPEKDIKQKIEEFNLNFPEVKLSEQVSDMLMKRQTSTTKEDEERIKKYTDELIKKNPKYAYTLKKSIKQLELNKKFIVHLHKSYPTKINFSLGSLSSNLMKSFVKKKPLLVYVHKTIDNGNISTIMKEILSDQGITKFINSNFVVYGMFDNSDDYSLVQPHIPMSMLPACGVFSYNEKKGEERCHGVDGLISKEKQAFVDFLSKAIKKYSEGSNIQQPMIYHTQVQNARQSERRLKDQQQELYDQLEKDFKMKREMSKLRKIDKQKALEELEAIKAGYTKEPEGDKVITLQFRQPIDGKPITRRFELSDKVSTVFRFVKGFCSASFENEFGDFDLIQTFPRLSLKDKQDKTLDEVFEGSHRQALIIKQI